MSGYEENIGTREYKERRLQLDNKDVITTLENYKTEFSAEIAHCHNFFANQSGRPLSDQAVRRMINSYSESGAINFHITTTYVPSLLCNQPSNDIDIRCIQKMLVHSPIIHFQSNTKVLDKITRHIYHLTATYCLLYF